MQVFDFFRDNFDEVVGVYHDGERIFFAKLSDNNIETTEINFESFSNDINALADRIAFMLTKKGWKNPKIGLCLTEGHATTFQSEFKNIPEDELDSAVKSWARAHAGENAACTYKKFDDEIWMEALSQDMVDEYTSAFEKYSLTLYALTEIPQNLNDGSEIGHAKFAAEIVKSKDSPNLLNRRLSYWNVKKIIVIMSIIFASVLGMISTKLFYDYRELSERLQIEQEILDSKAILIDIKKSTDSDIAEMKNLNDVIVSQKVSAKMLNALITIGKIADGNVIVKKINASEHSIELEGTTERSEALRNYASRLKSSLHDVKIESSSATGGKISFTLRATLKD